MKKFSLLLLMTLIVPGLSLASTDPVTAACNKLLDAQSTAFFNQQAADRDTFKKQNPQIIANYDNYGREMMLYKDAESKHLPATPPTPYSDPTYTDFFNKQLGDKNAFLAKLEQERTQCLASGGTTL